MSGVIKVCGCGREYDIPTWLALRLNGRQDDGVEAIELRTCHCGSTIAVPVSDLGESS